MDVRLTLRLKEGERLEWEAAAGADVPLSRFVKRVVNEHVRGLPRAGVVRPDVKNSPLSDREMREAEEALAKMEADPVTKAMRALDELKPLAREVKPDPRRK